MTPDEAIHALATSLVGVPGYPTDLEWVIRGLVEALGQDDNLIIVAKMDEDLPNRLRHTAARLEHGISPRFTRFAEEPDAED